MDDKKKFRELILKKKLIESNLALVLWELETKAPKKSQKLMADIVTDLSMQSYSLSTSQEFTDIVNRMKERSDLTEIEKKEVEILYEEIEKKKSIPAEEYEKYTSVCALNQGIWEDAKKQNDFSLMLEPYTKVFEYNKKFASYRKKNEKNLYDVVLNDYEKNMTVEKLDKFFNQLKEEIVPLLKKIIKKKEENKIESTLNFSIDTESQKKFNKYICDYLGFDFDRGIVAESEHPFTTNLDKNDVRFTTKYIEEIPFSSLFSSIHELGHAIYEQQTGDELVDTLLGGGGSMGLHESQSRFMENIIGRNKNFWEHIYSDAQKFYPQLKNIPLDDFYRDINVVEPSLIRTEADELTYSLHIMVRYEIEKMIFNQNVDMKDLPKIWSNKMYEYLGIIPENDTLVVMQDVHWPTGLVGYFPSYALGNAYAAQIYNTMKKEIDVDNLLKSGNVKVIREWLKNKIHKYGKLKDTEEIIINVTGEELNPKYYIDYLKEKYSKIYNL